MDFKKYLAEQRRKKFGDVLPNTSDSVYRKILDDAREKERTHHQRRGMKLRQWFKNHPECYYPPMPSFIDDDVLRNRDGSIVRMSDPKERIILEFRMGEGWFDRVVDNRWIGLPQHRCTGYGEKWLLPPEEEMLDEFGMKKEINKQLSFDW